MVSGREAVVVIGEGAVSGSAAASLLLSDFAVLREDATLLVDTPDAWAGVIWRLGRDTAAVLLEPMPIPAARARVLGLCDQVGEFSLGNRSRPAFDSAATLLCRRGGDRMERAEFARLFAAGLPQEGLSAFLEKRPPRFSE